MTIKKCLMCSKEYKVQGKRKITGKYCSFSCRGIGSYRNRVKKPSEYLIGTHRSLDEKLNIKLHNAKYWAGKKRPDISNVMKGKKPKSYEKLLAYSYSRKGLPVLHLQSFGVIAKRNANLARGDKHPNWKGGITPIYKTIRKSKKYREWREKIFTRDDYTCQICGIRNGNGSEVILNADHIKPFSLYPELRFELSNGRTLCINCHRETDTWGGGVKNYDSRIFTR